MTVFWVKFVKVWTNFKNFIENFKSFKKILKVFKKILINNLKNLTKIWNFSYYRFSLLAEAWAFPQFLQIFRALMGNVPPSPLATPLLIAYLR